MKKSNILIIAIIQLIIVACSDKSTEGDEPDLSEELLEVPDWAEATHGNNVSPNYAVVFPQSEVLRIDVQIDETQWATMLSDLQSNISTSNRPGNFSDFDPVWVTSSVIFEGTEWYKVGIRFKGNSSLHSTYRSGINKLSFKLDFDEFEDDYPLIKNQRFFGFKQLNLKNNYDDASMMREKVSSDLFREFGLASSQSAFCELYVDFGEGQQYFGLYTLVEEVDDTVLESQFSDDSGNLYKPDGDAASFAYGTFNEAEMELKTNEDNADYSDVYALYTVINDASRTNELSQWMVQLEEVFDTDIFLKWLAANTVMQNWDTYGVMTHNYYLYNDPTSAKLCWIPWDGNESLQAGKMGGALSLSLAEVGNDWPLIRYIIDVPEYSQNYDRYVREFSESQFAPDRMIALYDSYFQLIKESAYKEEQGYTFLSSSAEFDQAVEYLKSHVQSRQSAVQQFLEH